MKPRFVALLACGAVATEVPGNILMSGDFESGCAGWNGTSESLIAEHDDVHSGQGACRVCAIANGGFTFSQVAVAPVPVGAHLVAKAWVKLPKTPAGSVSRVMSVALGAGYPGDNLDSNTRGGRRHGRERADR